MLFELLDAFLSEEKIPEEYAGQIQVHLDHRSLHFKKNVSFRFWLLFDFNFLHDHNIKGHLSTFNISLVKTTILKSPLYFLKLRAKSKPQTNWNKRIILFPWMIIFWIGVNVISILFTLRRLYVQVILCNDCQKRGTASFHWHYHKCPYCGSYNTRLIWSKSTARRTRDEFKILSLWFLNSKIV